MARPPDQDAVFRQVMASAKYRNLDEAFARRVAAEAAARCADQNAAVKYAKRKLHQAFGAFGKGSLGNAVRACLAAIRTGEPVREACLAAMRMHASSAERVSALDAFYQQIEAWCGRPQMVADLACGLNPLAIPWLATAPGATYWCCDVDRDLTSVLPALSEPFGIAVQAEPRDLLQSAGVPAVDLVLFLKTLTTLEQQRGGAARDVLAALDAPRVVVSLPRGSLSARRRYADDAAGLVGKAAAGSGYEVADDAAFGDELLYLLLRSGP